MTTQFLLWPQVTEIASEVLRDSAQGQGRYRCTVLARPSLAQFSALTPRPKPLDDVAGRYWLEKGQHYAAHRNIWKRLALLVEFFGKDKLISDIADDDVAKLVAWRRGHCTRCRALVAPGTVNMTTMQLKTLFATLRPRVQEPEWRKHWLPVRQEHPRELMGDEGDRLEAATRDDYAPLFALAKATGMRQSELLLRWSEVDFAAKQIRKQGKGDKPITVPITSTVREILWPLQGHHPEHVFTYVAVRTHRGWVKGPALSDHAGRAAGALAPAAQGCWRHCLPLP